MLPQALRAKAPARLRDHPRARAVAVGAGLIPPRTMHTSQEAALLASYARGARSVVELGVYEGSSARLFCRVLDPGAELHLVDPFVDESGWSMFAGWYASPVSTKLVVRRACRRDGPTVRWYIARSQDVGRTWTAPPVDMVFVDGDHSPAGVQEDWEVWHPHVRPGGVVAFHDARHGLDGPGGFSSPGPTSVVNGLFRTGSVSGWEIADEVDSLVVVRHAGHGP